VTPGHLGRRGRLIPVSSQPTFAIEN
jgi:hypothetical protein